MVYNPIFEEEMERKVELKKLKKDIKKRARKETINHLIRRVYKLLRRKPILTITSLFHPLTELLKTTKAKEV